MKFKFMKFLSDIFRKESDTVTEKVMNNKGSQNPNAKLSDGEVIRIRELWAIGHRNTKVIARTFKVSPANIMKIVKKKTWTHI